MSCVFHSLHLEVPYCYELGLEIIYFSFSGAIGLRAPEHAWKDFRDAHRSEPGEELRIGQFFYFSTFILNL